MKNFQNNLTGVALIAALSALLVAGCGGGVAPLNGPTRGEGNIPLGKVSEPRTEKGKAIVRSSGGTTTTLLSDADGIFWSESLPAGPTSIRIIPDDPALSEVSFTVNLGVDQNSTFEASLPPVRNQAIVESVTVELNGRTDFRVGMTVPVKVTIKGRNLGSLKPIVWLDGGVGQWNPGRNLQLTQPGLGVVRASALGVTASAEFTVR